MARQYRVSGPGMWTFRSTRSSGGGGCEVLDKPVYLRPPEYLYTIRADPPLPLFTGCSPDGRQVLVIADSVLVFDREGRLVEARGFGVAHAPPAGFAEGPIAVRRFWLPDRD